MVITSPHPIKAHFTSGGCIKDNKFTHSGGEEIGRGPLCWIFLDPFLCAKTSSEPQFSVLDIEV